ncbi:Glycosyl transferases group 1 [Prevotella sp. khp1]|uniref:glycosyltransferase family 4 protein n=1 Tax=Prevotellaceae TaxID=171552 RepID=UPI0008893BFC|nr:MULTISPECIES: glycosyltransferase [Prevotellaceae]QVJ80595.1 glycosyltransferase [Xylanibacter ruminicola]SDQ18018.1 Glycosyl transferases group 1 [Prevotella sp. khp1]
MTITFFFNYLNHHQVLVADAMYEMIGNDFHFVATCPRDPKELKGGLDYSNRPYCILSTESENGLCEAHRLNIESDVCVFGAGNLKWENERSKTNKLSFEVSERWLKKGWRNVFSPRLIKWWLLYQFKLRKKPFYRLCCSAFTAEDDVKLGCYKGCHYKWGYFTKVEEKFVEAFDADVSTKWKVHILWCARFLLLKHPELVIELADRLKKDGYDVAIDMYGDEPSSPCRNTYPRKKLLALIDKLDVADIVTLKGNRPNSDILKAMQEGDIFLFTSDRLEGWGAVANESMANGCVLVASDAIGSTRYLVKHKETGMIYRSCDLNSLYEQVRYLLDNPDVRKQIAKAGRESMVKLWSPANAAKSLLKLIENIQVEHKTSVVEGPCSKA